MTDHVATTVEARLVERFRPSRAGIVHLWDYVDERFEFDGGRLVLRGANGSGKTKALEVLFPFVLDARLIAQRLDPFTATGRNMRENILYRRDAEVAVGYAWMEFERQRPDGQIDYRTIGAGMRAQTQRDEVMSWFFVTDRSPDRDFSLVGADGRPLTRRQLAETLGDDAVMQRGADYRSRVDSELFGLGDDRYDALLQLVLFLRRPQLAKDLDLGELSRVLAEGLRPVDDELVGQAARSFEDLEHVQRELERLQGACAAADSFLDTYRRYLRANARQRVDVVSERRETLAAAEARTAELDATLEAALDAKAEAERRRDRVGREAADADAARDALRRSDAYRAAESLSHLEGRVADGEAAVASATRDDEQAAQRRAEADDLQQREQARLREVETETARSRAQLTQSADQAGLDVSDLGADASDAARHIKDLDAGRRADLAAVRELMRQRDLAAAAVDALERQVDEAESAEAEARTAMTAADASIAEARRELTKTIAAWASEHATVIDDDDAQQLTGTVDQIGEPGVASLVEIARTRVADRRDAARTDEITLQGTIADLTDQRAAVQRERDTLADQGHESPPAPHTRAASRDERPGAPLWRLVDFRPDLDPQLQPAVEAALESAGLLDAWVLPTGLADTGAIDDSFLAAPDGLGPSTGRRSLSEVLVADESASDLVPTDVVTRVLDSIGWSDLQRTSSGPVGVDGSGAWHLGPLHGHWSKTTAEYIGASARAAHRARRLAELDAQIAGISAEMASTSAAHEALRALIATIDHAIATVPAEEPVLDAIRAADRVAARLAEATAITERRRVERDQARRSASDAQVRLEAEAKTRRLPVGPDELERLAAALDRFRDDGATLVNRLSVAASIAGHLATVSHQAAARAEEHRATGTRLSEQREHLAVLATELQTLRASLGDSAQAVLDKIDTLERQLDRLRHEREAANADVIDRTAAAKGFEVERAGAAERITDARTAVEQDATHLAVFARRDVLAVLDPQIEKAPELARADHAGLLALHDALRLSTEGASATDDRIKAVFTALSNAFHELQAGLGAEYQPELDVEDNIEVFSVADELGRQPVSSFAARLAVRRDEQSALLSERERRVFEDTLLASLASQIHQRIIEAHDQVDRMNKSLEQRSMSSGLRLQLSWSLPGDLPTDQRAIARLLERDPALFNEHEREQLRGFFASEISDVRSVDPGASYKAVLMKVLDYRRWRTFTPRLIHAGGNEQVLTRKVFSTLSGGEKATALHLPLFAAAAAHYASARPEAPHLIALDEAFAGIDDDTQAKLMGLTVEFDLDLFLTGHDLWGTHASVPALAIYDLIHLHDEQVVHGMRYRWNGSDLEHLP